MATSLRSELQNARMEAAAQLSVLGVEFHSSASSSPSALCVQRPAAVRVGDRTDFFGARGNAQSGGAGVREFKAELEGIGRKLQSQADLFVNRFLAVCVCSIAVRFEDHSEAAWEPLACEAITALSAGEADGVLQSSWLAESCMVRH